MSSQTTEERRAEAEASGANRSLNNPAAHRATSPGGSDSGVGAPQRNRWIIFGALALVAAAILFFVLSRRGKQQEAAAPPAANATGTVTFLMEQQWLIKMKLTQVETRSLARQIAATGRVIPAARNQAIVAPPVGGLIAGGQLPRVGQQVARGQTIAVLRQMPTAAESAQIAAGNAQLRIEQARLEAERQRLTETLNGARAQLSEAKAEYERAQRLYEGKAYSQRQLEAQETAYKVAEANYNATVQQLEVLKARAAVREVPGAPASYTVAAPLSGTVVKVSKAMGEQVAPGEAIIEIVNLETVWVEAPIFERDLARLGNRARAVFTTPAHPGTDFTGSIINIGAVIDEQSRAATVIFEVPNRGRALRIGMQADVRLGAGEEVTAMMIPKAAVLDNEGKKIVYVLLSGEEFERREVKLGDEYGDRVAVLSGLKEGERVVTQGAYQIRLQELRPADAGVHSHET